MPSRLKQMMVQETAEYLRGLRNIVLIGYRGLDAQASGELRKDIRQRGMTFRVIRNRITVRALSELGNPELGALIQGPTAVLDGEDPALMARAAVEFAKRSKGLEIRGGCVDGQACTAAEIRTIAQWPSRPEILAGLASTILAAAGAVAAAALGPGGRIAGALGAHAEKLEQREGAQQDLPAETSPVLSEAEGAQAG